MACVNPFEVRGSELYTVTHLLIYEYNDTEPKRDAQADLAGVANSALVPTAAHA